MKPGAPGSFGAQLKALREAAGFTQEELATIAGLSVHAVSALERGERRRPHVETVRALSAALDLTGATRDAFCRERARRLLTNAAVDELSGVSLPMPLTPLLGRDTDVQTLRQWLADPAARLITLIGPGGVGKTRLALELARAIAEEGATRVVFVPLAAIRDPAFVAPAIAEALGLSDVTALDLPKRARAACDGSPHAAGARQFRARAGRGAAGRGSPDVGRPRFDCSSPAARRSACGASASTSSDLSRWRRASDAMSPADLARAASRAALRGTGAGRAARLSPHAANGPTVTAICRRLDALPLALELAAPWIKVLTARGSAPPTRARCPALAPSARAISPNANRR